MAWVLVTGEDDAIYHGVTRVVRREGYEVVAAPDGATALQLLVDVARVQDVVVLLRPRMGQLGATEFLSAVATEDILLRWHAYILLDGPPVELPAEVERFRATLAIPQVAAPLDADDEDGWADLLDAINLAVRQLPAHRPPSEGAPALR